MVELFAGAGGFRHRARSAGQATTMAEQTQIVAAVDHRLSMVREVEAKVDANVRRAQALRRATLSKAFVVDSLRE